MAVAVVGLATAAFSSVGSAETTTLPVAFSGSAAAGGIRFTLTVPGAPGTDTPLDGGGPTAQVAVDSIGSSTGYAAFPDPGQFIVSIPGLGAGLLAGGAAGLPPIKLPSPPNYPFFVSSDASNNPEARAGSGPYQLSASSESNSSKAQATSGFQPGLSGNTALADSAASLVSSESGVVAKAVSDVQGLGVGPLTIGEIKATATMTMDASGFITPSSHLEITGMYIGGVPVKLAPEGFVAGGPTYPVPINPTLHELLKASGISVQVVSAQSFPDRVVAPALQITVPFAMPGAIPNQVHGTATLIVGSATAQMSGAATPNVNLGSSADVVPSSMGLDSSTAVVPSGGDPGSSISAPSGGALGSSTPVGASGRDPASFGLPAHGGPGTLTGTTVAPSPRASRAPAGTMGLGGRAVSAAVVDNMDVRPMYLIILAGALAALGLGEMIRQGGRRWNS